MQRLTVFIRQATDRHKELKQKLAFVIMLEQPQAKRLAIRHKVKELNVAIKKDLAVHKIFLQVHQDNNNKNKKPVLSAQVASAHALIPANAMSIDNDYNGKNIDNEKVNYANALINSNN